MTTTAIMFGILAALLLGAMSPGPSFVLVSRLAASRTRQHGVAAAAGMGVGGAIFALLALGGLIAVLVQADWLFVILKICGGLYLVHLGIRIWRSAGHPLSADRNGHLIPPVHSANRPPHSWRGSFWLGLATQIANPKTAVVYAGIFAAFLPADPPLTILILLPPAVFLVEFGWYALVATVFSATGPRRTYLASKGWLDRLSGAVLGALGARLIMEEVR